MTIDYEALRSYNPGGGGASKMWLKLTPSETGQPKRYTIRLLPTPDNAIFYDTTLHYFKTAEGNLNGECPRVQGGDCPACELYFRTIKAVSDPALKQKIKDMGPSTRVYVNAVLRAVDKDLVPENVQEAQIWSLTYRLFNMLKDEILNSQEEGMDLLARKDGHDIVAKVVPMGGSYKVDTISVKPAKTDISEEIETYDLEPFARQRVLTTDDVKEQLPKIFGADKLEELMVDAGLSGGLLD